MSDELLNHPHAAYIWQRLMWYIENPYGVAALMGNLQAESGLYPDRVQGDVPYSSVSQRYTANVDSGATSRSEFINDSKGYGLAQWTFSSRKAALYDFWKDNNFPSIGDADLGIDFLIVELTDNFSDVLDALFDATSIRAASDVVLHDFENPADQSESVERTRAAMGTEIYNTFSGLDPIDPDNPVDPDNPDPDNPSNPTKRRKMSLLLMLAALDD